MRRKVSGILFALLLISVFTVASNIQPIKVNSSLSRELAQATNTDWWPMFHHDPSHTGTSTSAGPTTNNTMWTYGMGEFWDVSSSPAVVGGLVYMGFGGELHCLSAATGALVWSVTIGEDWVSSPAVVGGLVYVASGWWGWGSYVHCLNATTQASVWSFPTGGYMARSPPTVADGFVYVGCDDHNVYCLNSTSGALVWGFPTGAAVRSSPAVVDGLVYVGSMDGNVYCLNTTANGALVWGFPTGGSVESSPAVVDGLVYVGSHDYKVYCLDAATKALIWSFATGGSVESSPAVVGGVVYVGSNDGNVYALNVTAGEHGEQIWKHPTGNSVKSSPAVADGIVFVGSCDNNVYALNATGGTEIWSYTTGNWVVSSPAVVGGAVYVGSSDGFIYAFGNHVNVYRNLHREPAPMGIADYGVGPSGGYEYATYSFVGTVTIASLLTNSSLSKPPEGMSFQLNVNLVFNTSQGQRVYWIQDVAYIYTSWNWIEFLDNMWNHTVPHGSMTSSGISGNGNVSSSHSGRTYYAYSPYDAGKSLPGNDMNLTYPTTIKLNVTSWVNSSSGKPTVSFAYDDGCRLITYDVVTFNVAELTSFSGFEVNGFSYTPFGSHCDSELILGGPASGNQTTNIQSDVRLQLQYWNGHNYETVPNAYNFGDNTAETINNTLSEFSHYPENGTISARIQPGHGKLGELYDQSQTGVFNITSPLDSGILYVTNASDPNATAWKIPFVNGEVTVTLYPGSYELQLYDQNDQLFDEGDFTVNAGQTMYLQAPFGPPFSHPIAGTVGITGYKLVFKETMRNTLSSPTTVDYHWNFSVDKWDGAQWLSAGISNSTIPVTGYSIPALSIVDLPYYVYVLPMSGPNAVAWDDWLRIGYTFHWTYNGTNYSTDYTAKLNVHSGDIAGAASITLPYLGADDICNIKDVTSISLNWQKSVPPSTDPTSALARADINDDGIVNIKDVTPISLNWQKTWTNAPP